MLLYNFFIAYCLLTAIAYMAMMIYYVNGNRKCTIPELMSDTMKNELDIDIVVCFRNEENNLPALLESIAELNYSSNNFRVILYNDSSDDNSLRLIDKFIQQYPDIRIICNELDVEKHQSPKKHAIIDAATKSTAKLIAVTDADCILPTDWLTNIAISYQKTNARLICGPILVKHEGSAITKIQEIENSVLMTVTGGAIGHKKALLCNGANMAFERTTFLELLPYKANINIRSGDDMFLLMAVQKYHHESIVFINHRGSIVSTSPKKSLTQYINQRLRWVSKSKHYPVSTTTLVGALVLNTNIMLIASVVFLANKFHFSILFCALSVLLIKSIADYMSVVTFSRISKRSVNFSRILLFEYLEALLTIIIAVKSIKGSYEWKGRMVKA